MLAEMRTAIRRRDQSFLRFKKDYCEGKWILYKAQRKLLSPLQSGFKPSHSTVTALLKVTGDIRKGMEDTKVIVLVLVDFLNAFNTVSHEILLSILAYLLISLNYWNGAPLIFGGVNGSC